MKIIWIEDFDNALQSAELAQSVFSKIVSPDILRREYNKDEPVWSEFPRIFNEHSLHQLHICRSYTEWKDLFNNEQWDFDIALIDINLEGSETLPEDLPKGIDGENFDKRAGFYIYHQLLKNYFPDQNIAFFTGNGELLVNFEKYCQSIPIETPQNAFRKNEKDEGDRLSSWLADKERTPYLTLRRGIIEGCQCIKDMLYNMPLAEVPEHLLFYQTTSLNIKYDLQNYRDYVCDYLTKLQHFFPLRPQNTQLLYTPFLKELSAEWEISSGGLPRRGKELEDNIKILCQQQMKRLRNWSVHRMLPEEIRERDVAYLFMLAMRAWIELPLQDRTYAPDGSYAYERLLANLFTAKSAFPHVQHTLLRQLRLSYQKLRKDLQNKKNSPRGDTFNALLRYVENVADPKNSDDEKSKEFKDKFRKESSTKLLYQHFWHGMFPARLKILEINATGPGVAMFVYFRGTDPGRELIIPKKSFPYFLGKLIFKEAFH